MADDSLSSLYYLLAFVIVVGVAAWWLWPLPLGRLLIRLERQRNGVRSKFVRVAGIRWHYLEGGQGETVLALHGIAADADHWTRMTGCRQARLHVIAPDLPGFGNSDAPADGDYRLEQQVTHLHDFVQALGLESFILAGNSMGGQIAAAYALRHPELVRGLCLLAPSGIFSALFSPVMKLAIGGDANPLIVKDRPAFERLLGYCFFKAPYAPGPVLRLMLHETLSHQANTAAAFDAMRFFSSSLEHFAPQLQLPCLLIWGENDKVLDVSGAYVLQGLLPDVKLRVMPETGHLPMLERPRESALEIRKFVDGLPR